MGLLLEQKIKSIRRTFHGKAARQFEATIASIVDNVVLARFIRALEFGTVADAVAVLDIDRTTAASLSDILAGAFNETGVVVAADTVWRDIGARRVVIRWDMRNPAAEEFLSKQSSRLVTNVFEKTKDVIADQISESFRQGKGPRSIALDIVGRIGPNGKRTGGIVGLTGPQAEAVNNMRKRLKTGDIRLVKTMSKRDMRFDPTLDRHIKNGTRPNSKTVEKMVSRYSQKLLKLRGDTIARTETGASVLGARYNAYKQWQQKTGVSDQFIVKTWNHTGGGKKSRDTHLSFDGHKVRGLDTAFLVPSQKSSTVLMLYPLDTSLGAKAGDVINCTCDVSIRIDHAGLLKAVKGG